MQLILNWFKRHFSDPQVVILAVFLLSGGLVIALFGKILAPVLTSLILAYLLEGVVEKFQKLRAPRWVAVLVVFSVFMTALLMFFFALLPKMFQQLAQLVQALPSMLARGQQQLLYLPERYPDFFTVDQIRQIMEVLASELMSLSQRAVSVSVASVRGVVALLIYLILVPFMIFFFLKDKAHITAWVVSFLPENRSLVSRIWREVDQQIGNYVRGKFWEIVIVWSATFITFTLLEVPYAMLLSVFVGLSVLVPYIGAIVMFIPITLIAYFQWGWESETVWVLVAYSVIQLVDGNILSPILLSGVTDLHPLAVILAVILFGGWWGFWGVFFAIPLATLVHAILKAWPTRAALRDSVSHPEFP